MTSVEGGIRCPFNRSEPWTFLITGTAMFDTIQIEWAGRSLWRHRLNQVMGGHGDTIHVEPENLLDVLQQLIDLGALK